MLAPVVLASTLVAAPVAATGYALLDPAAVSRALDPAERGRIIEQANAAAARPPRARADLHTEGTLPGKGIREESLYAKQDQPAVLALGLAWRATGDRRYLDAATRYLTAWAITYRPSLNPIDETGFDMLLLAQDLVSADLSPGTRAVLDRFWRGMAVGYLDAMDGVTKNQHTNWQSHRVKLATMAAFATGDKALIARARSAYRRQVEANIHADGSVFDFTERDALHYVTYDLDPLLMAALAARAHGEDWYRWRSPSGASLAGAVHWLQPYALGEKTHIEFVHSRIQFDRDRAAAGQAEYAPHPWDRRNAVQTFALATKSDAALAPTAARIAQETGGKPPAWIALLR
jgi:hypothetical protein